nr:nicastrin [Helicoverpa armigera]
MAPSNFLVLILILCVCSYGDSQRLHERIYSSIEGGAACFRRLNGTHQTGCSSADNGAVGVVHMIKDISDAQWLMQNASAGPYMAVVSTAMFYDVYELLLSQPALIAGVLLHDNVTRSAPSFSQESRCPNEYSSADGSTCSTDITGGIVWNERGTGLLRADIPFPIFYLPESRAVEVEKIDQCYRRYNADRDNQKGMPLCSLQLHSFMFAAVDSEVCLRRSATSALLTPTKVCDPLGDHNIYASLFPRTKDSKKSKVTLVTARIDSASMFDGVSPGAASSVVGMVTLLTAATALSKMIPAKEAELYDQNILWTLFNGEAFDYIGSQRVAYDISKGAWPAAAPLAPSDISLHVELGQIGGALDSSETTWPLHAFVPYTTDVPEIAEFLNILSSNINYNLSVSTEFTTSFPPSSLHSFRRILKNETESGALPELLLTDHKTTFANLFYHSVLDDYKNVYYSYHNISVDGDGNFIPTDTLVANGTMRESDSQVKIARLATVVARTLYQRVAGKAYAGNISVSAHMVDELLYCFLRNQNCRMIMAADYVSSGGGEWPAERAAPLYVGVAAWASSAPVYAAHLLALLTGTRLGVNRTACDAMSVPGYSHYWLRGWMHMGVCMQTTMNISAAVSPAFIIADYDLKSGVYSTWTESVWQAMWARVFVSSSGAGARAAAIAGAVATLLAALATYWLQAHAHRIFTDNRPESIVNDDAASGILRTVNC